MIYTILKELDLDPQLVIKKKYGKTPEITAYAFIESLVQTNSVIDAAARLQISPSTMQRANRIYLPELQGISWSTYLKSLAGYKQCGSCKQDKPIVEFSKRTKVKLDGITSRCKACDKQYRIDNAEHLKEQREIYLNYKGGREVRALWQRNNKETVYARNAINRANKRGAVPPWADLAKIKEIYRNCPEGYEVDHIYPLKGETTCGLHVENNLQYLTMSENRSKKNKLVVDTHPV